MSKTRLRLPVLATIFVLVVACGGSSNPTPNASKAPASAAAATPAPASHAATSQVPATATAATSGAPESTAPESTAPESGAPESSAPSASPLPTPVIVAPESVAPGTKVIRWFCCLGAGDDPAQVKVEKKVIEDFNASHTDVQIAGEFVLYAQAYDTLATEIAGGNPPDIVGPVGFGGANAFAGHWLDLQPLIDSTQFDTSQWESETVDFFKVGDAQEGLPFAIYPSALFYQIGAFQEIGINEPPHKYGESYVAVGPAAAALNVSEGAEVPWDYDTARTIAKLLTVDTNNLDATQDGFDPTNIAQYGFEPQRDDLRGLAAYWGAGSLIAADGTAQIPAQWATAWKWYYDGMWTDHTIVDGPRFNDQVSWNPDGVPFCNGKVSMAENFLWSTYCMTSAGDNWNVAAIPAYNGTQTAAFNADTFRIWKDTANPDAAFTVLQYLLGPAAKALTTVYGAMPAKENLRDAFFQQLEDSFGPLQVPTDWQVFLDGIDHVDSPNFESPLPFNVSGENTYNESVSAINTYATRWDTTPGLDMDLQIQQMQQDLQTIWNK